MRGRARQHRSASHSWLVIMTRTEPAPPNHEIQRRWRLLPPLPVLFTRLNSVQEASMRARSVVLAVAALVVGVVLGSMLNPQPTGAVSKEIIQLQEDVSQLLQGQQTMRSTIDANNASMRTLLQQSLDSVNALNQQMATLQKNVQEATANSSSKIDTMSTQTQGVSDNLQDVQARVGKVAAQINNMQSTLQSIDGRLAGGSAPSGAPAGGMPSAGSNGSGAPPSADSSNGAAS